MPSKRSGLRKSPRKAPTPLRTPPNKSASPKTPASGLGSSAKRKRTSERLSARKSLRKRLSKSFNQDDVDPDEEIDESAADDSRDEALPDPSELVPGDPPSRLDQLANSSDPLMQLVAEELRASKAREDALRSELDKQKSEAAARQDARDFEEGVLTKFHFKREDTEKALDQFVVPFLRDDAARQFYSSLQVSSSTQASVTRAFTTVKLTKQVRNKIYLRRPRDSRLSTKPRPLSDGEKRMYSSEQLAKEKVLSQMHDDFAPVLQVLYHVMHQIAGCPKFNQCVDKDYIDYMEELHRQAEDLVKIQLEYFGQHIAGPRRELFEKVTGLPVNPGRVEQGFMTEHEADAAMQVAQQQDLLQQHIAAMAPNPRGRGRGAGKGKDDRAGRRPGGLHIQRQQQQKQRQQKQSQQQQQPSQQQSQPSQPQQQQSQPPAASAGTPAKGQKKSTTPGKNARGGGKGK